MARSTRFFRRGMPLPWIAALAACAIPAAAQTTLPYYFAHIATGGVWRTTFTYVNQTTQSVTCNTSYYSDAGNPLALTFGGVSATSASDVIAPGGLARRQTDAQPAAAVVTGWAVANCTGNVKASALFRSYTGNAAQAEASVPAMSAPATQFVTYADQSSGVAYANPTASAATVTFTARDGGGNVLATKSITLAANAHGSQNLGPLLGLSSFQGSIAISSSAPIVSLSLNAEAAPIISSLPPGQPDGSVSGPATYYFAHIAAGNVWRTTFTYVNAGSTPVTCATSFYSDSGSPLSLSFAGASLSSTTDAIAGNGIARRQTDAQPALPITTGWAAARCTGPVKAGALFREYSGTVPVGEASVLAASAAASQFVTYADQTTGVAYANPSSSAAPVTFTALDGSGKTLAATTMSVPPLAHGSANLGPLLGIPTFSGSVVVTSVQPIVSLSLNAEAYPSFSSLPPGDGASFQVYGVWHCSNDSCNWRTPRTVTDFDSKNHWIIDRGDGSALPSVNLVVLSFVQPTKLLNLTNDSQTVNGIPAGMTSTIVNYFTSHNVRVMLALGGANYVADWDTALTTNAMQLGINAANAAKAMGVGFEIDYENDPSPNLDGLQAFISAYRSILPYDPTGTQPAARLTIDLAAGDQYLVALCTKATSDWLTGAAPALDWANATVPNGQPDAASSESNWVQHADGRPKDSPPILPLAPARFTVAVRLELSGVTEPECNNFSAALQNTTGIWGQLLPTAGAGITPGILGYMFWEAEAQYPSTCEGGVGVGSKNYNIPVPPPPLRQQ